MKRALLITLNEVRLYLQDKGDLAFSLLLPVVTFALIYGAFGGSTLFTATASIVNEDNGAYSTLLIERLDDINGIKVELLTASEADAKLERSDLLLVLFIPPGFSEALAEGRPAEAIFKQRGNGGQEGQILASIIRSVAEDMNIDFRVSSQVKSFLEGTGIPEGEIDSVVAGTLGAERDNPTLSVKEEVVGGTGDLINQYLPGIVTMYVLFALTVSSQVIVEERRKGTLERLLTTRLTAGELFFGKYLASVARGFVQTVVLFSLAYAVFQMFTPASFVESLFIVLIFTAAAAALGMIIASVSRTPDAATWIGVVFTMVMVMLGGTFFEIPEGSVLGTMSKISINTYANNALRTVIAEGGNLGDTVMALVIFAGVAVAGLIISRLLFKAVPGGK